MMRKALRNAIRKFGFDISRVTYATDAPFGDGIDEIIEKVSPFTLGYRQPVAALCDAVHYIEKNKIEGAFVECGVWKGGSSMAAALALKNTGATNRDLYLYDTYEGMPPPTQFDVDLKGFMASDLLSRASKGADTIWRIAQLDFVREVMKSTGYPMDSVHLIKGLVQDTIPANAPEEIAILRLDTDWYESTKHELENLYPRLVKGGVLILDDYGYWKGSRKAVDDYFADKPRPLFSRIDYAVRMGIKA